MFSLRLRGGSSQILLLMVEVFLLHSSTPPHLCTCVSSQGLITRLISSWSLPWPFQPPPVHVDKGNRERRVKACLRVGILVILTGSREGLCESHHTHVKSKISAQDLAYIREFKVDCVW
jgi:hypothetical protein